MINTSIGIAAYTMLNTTDVENHTLEQRAAEHLKDAMFHCIPQKFYLYYDISIGDVLIDWYIRRNNEQLEYIFVKRPQ